MLITGERGHRSEPEPEGEDIVRTHIGLKHEGSVPKLLFCDNGSEFVSQTRASRELAAT
jgi:hypothetical protein